MAERTGCVSIRTRGRRAHQVRVHPFPAKTFPTLEAARRYELELLVRRAEGDRFVEPARTLAEEVEGWLRRWKSTRQRGSRTVEFYERSAVFWLRLGATPVSGVRRSVVQDLIAERAAQHPRSAKNELELLKRVLRDARARGQRVDETVLDIEPVHHTPRRGRALDVAQLYELASWFPEHSKRLVLLAGMIGARQRVWFEMTDDLLDLANGALAIPPDLAKNGRAHRVYLTSLEVRLFASSFSSGRLGLRSSSRPRPGSCGPGAGSANDSGESQWRQPLRTTRLLPAGRASSRTSPFTYYGTRRVR
jgi:hypothetical protein